MARFRLLLFGRPPLCHLSSFSPFSGRYPCSFHPFPVVLAHPVYFPQFPRPRTRPSLLSQSPLSGPTASHARLTPSFSSEVTILAFSISIAAHDLLILFHLCVSLAGESARFAQPQSSPCLREHAFGSKVRIFNHLAPAYFPRYASHGIKPVSPPLMAQSLFTVSHGSVSRSPSCLKLCPD